MAPEVSIMLQSLTLVMCLRKKVIFKDYINNQSMLLPPSLNKLIEENAKIKAAKSKSLQDIDPLIVRVVSEEKNVTKVNTKEK
jgi:hypothetical protein